MSDEWKKQGEEMASVLIEGAKAELGAVKADLEARLKDLGDQAAKFKFKALKARLEGKDLEADQYDDTLKDVGAQASGAVADAALETLELTRARLKAFVSGVFEAILKLPIKFD